VALEVDAEAVEEVQHRLEPRAMLIGSGGVQGFLQRGWNRWASGDFRRRAGWVGWAAEGLVRPALRRRRGEVGGR
jgi:hypothetical protein